MKYSVCDKKYTSITLNNDNNLEVTLCSYGASVFSIKIEGKEMLLRPNLIEDFYDNDEYYGKTLGRIAGRILSQNKINDLDLNLDISTDDYILHGGKKSLSFVNYNYEIVENSDGYVVTFKTISKDLESGFVGNVNVEVIYTIYRKIDKIMVEFRCASDQNTILNMSNHMYFNFSTKDVLDYNLYIPAKTIQKMKPNMLPYDLMDIPSALDFSSNPKIKDNIEGIKKLTPNTIDNTFILDKNECSFSNDEYIMEVKSSYNALNCYLNCTEIKVPYAFETNQMYRGLAIEFEHNNLDSNKIYLKKGETYYNYIVYEFKKVEQ